MKNRRSPARENNFFSWLVLGVGLVLVAAATLYMKTIVERAEKLDFDVHCNEIKNRITDRLYVHARILRSCAAFFNADEEVTRDEWHVFARREKAEQFLPGIQGLGFSLLVPRAGLARHIQEIRSEGFPEYTVKPVGDRDIYTPVIYLEPFDERNQRAFGYDTFSEPVRRAAMERARDEDSVMLSGKVTLVQETDEDVQAGTLMYAPVYRKGMPIGSVKQRRAALYGWVSGVYRMTDLFQGILGDYNLERDQHLHLQVFDGGQPLPRSLLYQCHSIGSGNRGAKEQFNQLIPIDFNGHRWTLRLVQIGNGFFTVQYTEAWLVLFGGTLVVLLLFVLIRTLQGTRSEAQRMAQDLTVDLREERQRMASIIQGTNVGTWEWNVQTGDVVFNETWAQIVGYTLEELAPVNIKTWRVLTHPDDLKQSNDLLQRHFSGELPFYDCECRMKHKDGRWIWVQDRGQLVTRTGDGQPLMMYGTHAEISARKQAEERIATLLAESNQARNALLGIIEDEARTQAALRKGESALREAQAIARLGSYVLDIPAGRWTSSDVLNEVLGIDATYDRSMEGWVELIHPDDRDMMSAYLKNEIIGGRKSFDKEYRIIRPNDRVERWVQGMGRLEFDEQGLPVKMVGTIQDITERKQAEEKKLQLETQLHQFRKMEVIGQLAGGVAHDFNNILQSIMGHAQLAAALTDTASPICEDLSEIQKAARHAGDLTRQLLTFARKQSNDPRVIDLNQAVQKMLKMLRPLIGENIHLVWEPGADLWPVKMDPIQVGQILANLCVNARDAIDGAGEVHITTENRHVDGGPAAGNDGVPSGDYAVLAISDTGCGMDAETQEKIFEPFFTTKEVGKGTGLGLATVYGIVQQNAGHIGIRSEVGKGTTFRIYLPRFEGDLPLSGDAEPAQRPNQGFGTVLLVEDEPAVLEMGTRMLQTLGYTVLPAHSAEEALKLAAEHVGTIQLLLTDVVMPGMNGRELANILRKRMPHIKQLFMSGFAASVLEAHDGDPSLVGLLLTKPFSIDQLSAKIQEVMMDG
ncbi:MAG: CHASE domain-containing protein [Kiritimatiellales bacterium]|nr:CHASE domain-containing protein [Kiritimatiellales bacterium]